MKTKTQRLGIFTIIVLFLLSLSFQARGEPLLAEASHEFYVYDEANIVDSSTENYIVEVNKELYNKTGAQIVVALVNSLDSRDIKSYATSLFEKWEIGSRKEDNGLLILVSLEDSEIWIETGYGLEGALPAGRLKRIIDDSIVPNFADGNYNSGLVEGFNSILDYIEEEYNINLDTRDKILVDNIEDKEERKVPPIVILGFILGFIFIDFRLFRGWLTFSLLRGLGRGGPRGGPRDGPGGGSSGGGGRSGGGGAGGSW